MLDDVTDAEISQWWFLAGVRAFRAVVFFVAAFGLTWVAPYQLPNANVLAIVISALSMINQGSRVSIVALGILMLIAVIPKEIVLALI